MSTIETVQPRPPINPRPGLVKSLGICNILFSFLMSLCLLGSTFWIVALSSQASTKIETKIKAPTQTGPVTQVSINPFLVGMDDPTFLRFCMVDVGTAMLLNGLMFATGIGLINLKRWAARWWTYLAWTKILRLFFVWGFFIVGIAPALSENMGRSVVGMLEQQGVPQAKLPPIGQLTQIYSIANLVMGVTLMVGGSIYPGISLWVISRPGVKAAIVGKPATEPEFT